MLKYNFLIKISESLKNKNFQLVINLISLFIIFRFVFTVLVTIKGVVIYDLNHHFDYEYQKMIVNNNLFTHSMLLYTPIFLCLFALIKRKIETIDFALSIIISYLFVQYQWFDLIHNLIQNTFIFDGLRASGRTVINNQYTRIIFYVLLIIALLIQTIRKKTRTLSRIMILFMTTSCLFTVTVFHIAIPMGIFKSVLQDKSQNQEYEIKNYSQKDICKIKNCYYLYENGNIEIISELEKLNFQQYNWIIRKGIYFINQNKKEVFSEPVNVNAGFLFDYDILTMKKEENKFFTIIDSKSVRKFSRESEIMFSFLAIMAHFTWIFGTLILLEFHYYKFKKRIKNKIVEENK